MLLQETNRVQSDIAVANMREVQVDMDHQSASGAVLKHKVECQISVADSGRRLQWDQAAKLGERFDPVGQISQVLPTASPHQDCHSPDSRHVVQPRLPHGTTPLHAVKCWSQDRTYPEQERATSDSLQTAAPQVDPETTPPVSVRAMVQLWAEEGQRRSMDHPSQGRRCTPRSLLNSWESCKTDSSMDSSLGSPHGATPVMETPREGPVTEGPRSPQPSSVQHPVTNLPKSSRPLKRKSNLGPTATETDVHRLSDAVGAPNETSSAGCSTSPRRTKHHQLQTLSKPCTRSALAPPSRNQPMSGEALACSLLKNGFGAQARTLASPSQPASSNLPPGQGQCSTAALPSKGPRRVETPSPNSCSNLPCCDGIALPGDGSSDVQRAAPASSARTFAPSRRDSWANRRADVAPSERYLQAVRDVQPFFAEVRDCWERRSMDGGSSQAPSPVQHVPTGRRVPGQHPKVCLPHHQAQSHEGVLVKDSQTSCGCLGSTEQVGIPPAAEQTQQIGSHASRAESTLPIHASPCVKPFTAAGAPWEKHGSDIPQRETPSIVQPLSMEVHDCSDHCNSVASSSQASSSVQPLSGTLNALWERSSMDAAPSQRRSSVRRLSADVHEFLECRKSVASPSQISGAVRPLSAEALAFLESGKPVGAASKPSTVVRPLSAEVHAFWELRSKEASPAPRSYAVRPLPAEALAFLERCHSDAFPCQPPPTVGLLSAEALAFLERRHSDAPPSQPPPTVRPLPAEALAFLERRHCDASPSQPPPTVRPLHAEALAFLERRHCDSSPSQPPPTVRPLSAEVLAFLERHHSDASPSPPPPTVRPLPTEALAFLEGSHSDPSPSQAPPTVRPLSAEVLAFLECRHSDTSPSPPAPTVRPLPAEALAFLERRHSDPSPSQALPTVRPLPAEALAFLECRHSDTSASQAPPSVRPLPAEALAFLKHRHSDTSPSQPPPTVRPLSAEALAFLERHHSDASPSQLPSTARPLSAQALAFLERHHSDASSSQPLATVRSLAAEMLAFMDSRKPEGAPSRPSSCMRALPPDAHAFLQRLALDASQSESLSTAQPLPADMHQFWENCNTALSASTASSAAGPFSLKVHAFWNSNVSPLPTSSVVRPLSTGREASCQRSSSGAFPPRASSTGRPRSSQSTLCLDRLEARFSGNVWAAMLQGYPSSLGQPCPKEFEAGRGSHREESLPECSPSAEQSTPRACRGMDDTAAHTLLNAHHLSPEQHALRTREGSEVVSTASAVVQHVAPKVHDGCQHQGGDVPHGRTPCAVRPLSAEECQLWEACSTDSVQMHCTLSVRSTLQLGEAQAAGEDCGTYVQAASDPSIVSCSSTSYGTGPVPALALAIGDGECSVELSMKDQVHSMCEANCAVAGEADWGSSVPLEGDDRGNWERAHGDEASVLGQFGNVAAGQRHCEPSRVGEGESIGAMLDNVEEEESDDCWEDAISSDEVSEANVALEGPCPAEAEGAECGQHTEWYTARDGDDLSTLWEDCLLDADGDIPSVSKGECGPHDAGDVPQPVGFCTDAACPVGGAVQQDEGEQHRCQCNCDEQRPQNRPEAAPSLKLELSPASARTAHAEELQVQEAAVDFSSHHPHGAEDTNSRRVCAECKVPNQVLSPTGPKEEATLAQYPMLQGRFDLVCGSDGTRDARPTGQLQDNLLQPGRVVCTGDPHVLLLALDEAQPSAHPSTPVVQARDGPGCRAEGDARQKPEGYIPIIGASCPEGLMEGALGKEDVPSCGPQLKQSSDTVLETASMQELQMLPNEDGYILDRRDQQTLRGNFAANAEERGGINGGHPCGASAPRACPGRCAQGPPQPAEILHSKPEVAPDLFVEACPQPEGLPHTGEHLDAALEPYNGLARREVCVPLQSTRAQAWEEACELRPAVSVLKRIGCQDASLLQPTHGPAYSGKAFALGKLPSEEDCLVPSLWLAGQQVRDGPCDGAPTLPGFTVVPVSQRCHTRRALQAAEEGACWTAAAPCKASNPAECMKFHLETAQKAPAFEDRLCSEGAPSPSVTSQVNLYSLPASPTGQKPLLESPIPPTIATELPMASQLAGSSSWERQRQQELHQDNPAHARTAQDSQLYTVCASTLSWEPQLDKPFAHSTAKDSRLHSPAPSVGTIRCEPQMHTAITGDTAREPSRANPTVGAACRKPQLDNLAGTRSCQLQQDTGAADTAQLEGFTALAPATGSQLHFTAGPAVPLDLQSNPSASARTGECSSIYACFSNVVAMECASDLLGKSGMIVAGIGPEESTEQQLGGLNDEAKAAHQSGWQLALQQALRAAMDTPLMNSTCSVSQSPTGAGFESGSGKHPKPSNVGLDGPLPSLRFSGDQGVVSRVLAPDGGPSEAGLQICGHLQPLMTQPPELSREVERRSCIEEMEKVWVSGDDTARRHPGSGSPGHSDVPAFEEFVLAPSEVRNRFDDVSHGGAGPGGGHRRVRGQRDSRWLRLLGFGITQGYHIAGATVGIVEGMNSVAWSGIGACQNSLPGPLDVILNKGRVVTSR
eukprot:jgi/Botrbrau1/5920/Bobra.0366s0094.1